MAGHHGLLLDNADWLIEQHQFPPAVMLAHVAVEVYVEYAFTTLFVRAFGPLDDGWDEALPGRTFMDKASRKLWKLMTGHEVTEDKEVWRRYVKAVEYRNVLAHTGHRWPTPEQASESVGAVRAFISHLELTMEPIRAGMV
jgi:hypothetical protein